MSDELELNISGQTPEFVPNHEQVVAMAEVCKWFGNPEPYVLAGYAGTGKTTLVKHIVKQLGVKMQACAFTGKACEVLSRKGIGAITLHRLMYLYDEDEDKWYKRGRLDSDIELIVVDEASMVSKKIYDDLLSFKIPVLFLGDPAQLPPIQEPGEPTFNLVTKPNFILQEIMRQARDSNILSYATATRNGQQYTYAYNAIGSDAPDLCIAHSKREFSVTDLLGFDQIIVPFNKMKDKINRDIRSHLGRTDPICIGEKIIVLKNNYRQNVFNGEIYTVKRIFKPGSFSTTVQCDDGSFIDLWMLPFTCDPKDFPSERSCPKDLVFATYGYAITCHKSQGSEWNRVFVQEGYPIKLWEHRRWAYTAITRAAKHLTYKLNK